MSLKQLLISLICFVGGCLAGVILGEILITIISYFNDK